MSNAISTSKRNQVLISEHFYHRNQGLFLWGRAGSTEIQWHWVLAQLPGALQGPILLHNMCMEKEVSFSEQPRGAHTSLPLGLHSMIPFNLGCSVMCDPTSTSHPSIPAFSGACGTKAAAGAACIILCIWFFVLVSVTSKPAKKWPQLILAGGGWGSPGGSIHMPQVWPSRGWGASAWSSGWGPTPAAAPSWKQSIKETKGSGWDFHTLHGHRGCSQLEQPQECQKRESSEKAAQSKEGFEIWLQHWE